MKKELKMRLGRQIDRKMKGLERKLKGLSKKRQKTIENNVIKLYKS